MSDLTALVNTTGPLDLAAIGEQFDALSRAALLPAPALTAENQQLRALLHRAMVFIRATGEDHEAALLLVDEIARALRTDGES